MLSRQSVRLDRQATRTIQNQGAPVTLPHTLRRLACILTASSLAAGSGWQLTHSSQQVPSIAGMIAELLLGNLLLLLAIAVTGLAAALYRSGPAFLCPRVTLYLSAVCLAASETGLLLSLH